MLFYERFGWVDPGPPAAEKNKGCDVDVAADVHQLYKFKRALIEETR